MGAKKVSLTGIQYFTKEKKKKKKKTGISTVKYKKESAREGLQKDVNPQQQPSKKNRAPSRRNRAHQAQENQKKRDQARPYMLLRKP